MTAIYSALNAPSFKTKAVFFNKDKTVDYTVKIQFQNGVYSTDDEKVEKYLDDLIASSPNFSQVVRKLDRDAAASVSREWQAKFAQQNMVARGGTDSESANLARRAQQIYNEAISEGHSEEVAKKLVDEMKADNNYIMPEKVDPTVTSPQEGFVAGSQGKAADPNADVSGSVPEGSEKDAASAKEVAGAPSMKNAGPFAKKE